MHIQQLLVNRLRIGGGTAKCPRETPLHRNTEHTRSIPNPAPALINSEERQFALVLFITLAPLHLSSSCHFVSQGELLGAGARVSAHAAEIRDAQKQEPDLRARSRSLLPRPRNYTETQVRAKPGSCCYKVPMEMLLALPPELNKHKLSETLRARQNIFPKISFEKGEIIL